MLANERLLQVEALFAARVDRIVLSEIDEELLRRSSPYSSAKFPPSQACRSAGEHAAVV